MIKEYTLCDGRLESCSPRDLFHSYWGSAFLCCDVCVNVAKTRDSWGEIYND